MTTKETMERFVEEVLGKIAREENISSTELIVFSLVKQMLAKEDVNQHGKDLHLRAYANGYGWYGTCVEAGEVVIEKLIDKINYYSGTKTSSLKSKYSKAEVHFGTIEYCTKRWNKTKNIKELKDFYTED